MDETDEEWEARKEERRRRGQEIVGEWVEFIKEADSLWLRLMDALGALQKVMKDKEEFELLGWMESLRDLYECTKGRIVDEFFEPYQIDLDELIEKEIVEEGE